MAPEYGATCAISPIDETTLDYLRLTGRSAGHVALVEAYAKEQGLFHEPGGDRAAFSELLELDLSGVEPSIAGPSRPQDRATLSGARRAFRAALAQLEPEAVAGGLGAEARERPGIADGSPEEASAESFPASDPPSVMAGVAASGAPDPLLQGRPTAGEDAGREELVRVPRPVSADLVGGAVAIDDGHLVIAAITSCTNTSNPQVMVAAGLLAQRAVERGLAPKPWVKTSLAPGSRVVTDYLERAGLDGPLAELGFDLVGYGCTTCIGNSGPLLEGVPEAVAAGHLAVCAVLSGNRNFEGRIHPEAAAGRFAVSYATLYDGDERWTALEVGSEARFSWPASSTYVQHPPFLHGAGRGVPDVADIVGARALVVLGDSVTTDHI